MTRTKLTLVLLFTLTALVSTPAYATDILFHIGPPTNPTPYYNGEVAPPYPGAFGDPTISNVQMFVCLTGNVNTYWPQDLYGSAYNFTNAPNPAWAGDPALLQATEE